MNIQLTNKFQSQLHDTAQILHIEESQLAERALEYFIHSISYDTQLKQEFEFWDEASDEALVNFEKSL